MTGKGRYKGLAIDQAGRQIAFVSDRAEGLRLALRRGSMSSRPVVRSAEKIVGSTTGGIPPGFSVSEHGRVSLFEGWLATDLRYPPCAEARAVERRARPPQSRLVALEDPFLQTVQKVRAESDKKENFVAIALLSTKEQPRRG